MDTADPACHLKAGGLDFTPQFKTKLAKLSCSRNHTPADEVICCGSDLPVRSGN
jgi:hypothetical protein